jgi:hypothetical protein
MRFARLERGAIGSHPTKHSPEKAMSARTNKKTNSQLTNRATFARAFRLSNIAMFAVALQVRRLRSAEPEDSEFLFRKWSDFDFLVVSLTRLRRSVQLGLKHPQAKAVLEQALAEFDSKLPGIKLIRNVAEHIDDYAIERGRTRTVSRLNLESSTLSLRGPTLSWLGAYVNANTALRAAEKLFGEMQSAKQKLVENGS